MSFEHFEKISYFFTTIGTVWQVYVCFFFNFIGVWNHHSSMAKMIFLTPIYQNFCFITFLSNSFPKSRRNFLLFRENQKCFPNFSTPLSFLMLFKKRAAFSGQLVVGLDLCFQNEWGMIGLGDGFKRKGQILTFELGQKLLTLFFRIDDRIGVFYSLNRRLGQKIAIFFENSEDF